MLWLLPIAPNSSEEKRAITAKGQVADYVNRLPVNERPRWIAEYQLQGLVTLRESPAQQLPPRPGIPNPDIADIDEESVQSVINPGSMKVLHKRSQQIILSTLELKKRKFFVFYMSYDLTGRCRYGIFV